MEKDSEEQPAAKRAAAKRASAYTSRKSAAAETASRAPLDKDTSLPAAAGATASGGEAAAEREEDRPEVGNDFWFTTPKMMN